MVGSLMSNLYSLRIGVKAAPETMPAVLKQTKVLSVGYVPAVLTHSSGESPVVLSMTLSIAYLALLYAIKPSVLLKVRDPSGAKVPRQNPRTPS